MQESPSSMPQQQVQRIVVLRDNALRLLQDQGAWEEVEGYPGRVRSFSNERLFILYRTPFQPVPVSAAGVKAGVSPTVQRQVAREYGLDIWQDNKKVLSLIWNDGASVGIVLFKKGPWEEALIHSVDAL